MPANDPRPALEAALYSRLDGQLAVEVFNTQAPPETATPFVIFQEQAATHMHTFGTRNAGSDYVYAVKAIVEGWDPLPADNISALIDAALDDGALSVTGFGVGQCRREADVTFNEVEPGGRAFSHRGGLYRIVLYPA